MPYLVNNNQFTAQTATNDGINSGPLGLPNSGFGCSTVYMTGIDRAFMSPIDGAEGYTNSVWWYDIDTRIWGRYRPDPTNARRYGAFPSSTNNIHDYNGPMWGDNQSNVYYPDTGTIWRWNGNAGDNSSLPNQID